jgi:subfamily B ATP-binding cassette protein MsbA
MMLPRSRPASFLGSMRLTLRLARRPRRSTAAILALGALAALLEGLSLVLFIPLVQSLGGATSAAGGLEGRFARWLSIVPDQLVVLVTVVLLCLLVLAKNLAAFAGLWLSRRAEGQAAHGLRVRIFEQALSSCIDYRPGHRRSDIVNTLAENSWKVATALGLTYRVILCAATILVFIALMMLISVRLLLVALLFMAVGGLIIRRATARAADIGHVVVGENKAFGLHMWESVNALQLIRTFGRERHEADRFAGTSERLRQRLLHLDALWAVPGPVSEVAVVLLIGALILVAGQSGIGVASLAAFLSLLYRAQAPARELMQNKVTLDGMGAAIGDVAGFLKDTRQPFLRDGTEDAPPLREGIELRGVSFRYGADEPWALRDVSLRIPAGRTTAIVGRSGAGKSTLFALLFRFHDPTKGSVTADGVPLHRFRLDSWRGRLSLMSQDVQLFNDTVEANIGYGDLGASREAVRAAAAVAHADGFIEALPQEYETVVGDHGLRLSGGQRQRIALARTVLRNPDVLLLDEPTNALDVESERAFQEALARFSHRRTVIVIAHQLSTVLRADQVVVLDGGKVREVGSPAELIGQGGRFADMYELGQTSGLATPAGRAGGV